MPDLTDAAAAGASDLLGQEERLAGRLAQQDGSSGRPQANDDR